ncbi:lantibiotic dehydratase [Nocardia sp. SC052]|uniref:lantibiotic dehydratase n=1 Tax=Nocardia sichangensis TaxID=3385975 RepID=UPI0039A121EB
MLDTVVLRMAGYPHSLLRSVAAPDTLAEAEAVLRTWERVSSRVSDVVKAIRADVNGTSSAGNRAAHNVGLRRRVAPNHPASTRTNALISDYNLLVGDLELSLARLENSLANQLTRTRDAVRRLFTDEDLQQVILLSNGALYPEFVAWMTCPNPSASRTRRMTDVLTMYLQRIAAKNDTSSHFGPFAIGTMTNTITGIDWQPGTLRRRTFLSHWAARALAQSILTSNSATLVPRPAPLAFVDAKGLTVYSFGNDASSLSDLQVERTMPLSQEDRLALSLVDGRKTTAQIVAELDSAGVTAAEIVLQNLIEAKAVVGEVELPAGEADAFAALDRTIRYTHTGPPIVDRFRDTLRSFESAPSTERVDLLHRLKREFHERTGLPADRGSGRHYADRALIFEDATAPMQQLRIGSTLRSYVVDDLRILYQMMLLGPRIRFAGEREILRAWVIDTFGRDQPVPMGDLLERFIDARPEIAARVANVDRSARQAEGELLALCLDAWDSESPEVDVSARDIWAFLDQQPKGIPAVCNPDVMIGADSVDAIAERRFYGVVGDCHVLRDVISHGGFAAFLNDESTPGLRQELTRAYRAVLAPGETLVDVVRRHESKTSSQYDFELPHLELTGRSPKDRAHVILASELFVVADDSRISLHSPRIPGPIRLTAGISRSGTVAHDPTAAFSFPRSRGGGLFDGIDVDYIPRLRCGNTVLSRRRWLLRAPVLRPMTLNRRTISRDAADYIALIEVKQRMGFPDHCFAKFSSEPKPIYVDWSSPLLTRQFAKLCRTMTEDDTVQVSEMLPGPSDLWLTRDGHRYTSELRCVVMVQ